MRVLSLLCAACAAVFAAETSPTLTVKQNGHPLRAGCSSGAEQIATLQQGATVKIRFALAGEGGGPGPCYAVVVEVDGQRLEGYMWADGLAGLEEFERQRRNAASAALGASPVITRGEVQPARHQAAEENDGGKVNFALAAQLNLAADALQSGRPAEAEQILAKAAVPAGHRDAVLLRASALLKLQQPERAMDALEPALREHPKDPQLLALAGRAAYSLDDPHRALAYWRESQDLLPDPDLEKMCRTVEREIGADKSGEKSYGARFVLRYEMAVASPELARSMVEVLEEEFSRISLELGCPPDGHIITIIQSREAYFQTTGVAEWSGGFYDGKIRIPLAPSRRIDPQTRRVFAHEIVHACMASIGPWPAWLHEGLAQKLSGVTLDASHREVLKVLARAGKLPKLEALGNGWARLNRTQASVAYGIALAAVELFFEKFGQIGPRNLMNNPQMLEQITPALDQELEASLKDGRG